MSPRRSSRGTLLLFLALAAIALGAWLWLRARDRRVAVVTTPGPVGTTGATPTSTGRAASGGVATPGALAALPKPRPVSVEYKGCPATGDGGDPALNALKARGDSAAFVDVAFDAVAALPWPRAVERRDRARWARGDAAQVARYEGAPVRVTGWFASAKLEGPESVNCHGADTDRRDWHVWLAPSAGPARERSIVVETTPAIRARHPGWTLAKVRALARDGTPVRVGGWLLLDPEHPDQVGKTRGTIWEVHPIVTIEVRTAGGWVALDDWTVPRARRPR